MEYRIEIKEILKKTVYAEAEDEESALNKVKDDYYAEKITPLDADDYADTEFKILNCLV